MPNKTERPWDCLSAGLIVADFVTTPISHLPASGQLVLTDRIDFAIGGCAANGRPSGAAFGWAKARSPRPGSTFAAG